jgi:hypothetical protein
MKTEITDNAAQKRRAWTYVHSLRSPLKRAYATAYALHRLGRRDFPKADGLAFMTAQSVRIKIDEILAPDPL